MGLDEFGQVQNWPDNFMEEATNERIAILDKQAEKLDWPSRKWASAYNRVNVTLPA